MLHSTLLWLALVMSGHEVLMATDPPQQLPLVSDYQRCVDVENGPIAPDDSDDEDANKPASPPPGADIADYPECVMVKPGPLKPHTRPVLYPNNSEIV